MTYLRTEARLSLIHEASPWLQSAEPMEMKEPGPAVTVGLDNEIIVWVPFETTSANLLSSIQYTPAVSPSESKTPSSVLK